MDDAEKRRKSNLHGDGNIIGLTLFGSHFNSAIAASRIDASILAVFRSSLPLKTFHLSNAFWGARFGSEQMWFHPAFITAHRGYTCV